MLLTGFPYGSLLLCLAHDLAPYFGKKKLRFALKTGIISSVLIALTALKAITEKRLEFFREAASGYDVNAYAVNIVSTFEHGVQAIVSAAAAFWLRDSVAGWVSYYVAFLMLAWVCVSWALLFPLLVSPKNVVMVTGFFMAFFGILFSGGLSPVKYQGTFIERADFSVHLCIPTGCISFHQLYTHFTTQTYMVEIPSSPFSVALFRPLDISLKHSQWPNTGACRSSQGSRRLHSRAISLRR